MPALESDLQRLVALPSVSEWGFPEHTRVFTGGEDFHSRHEWICVANMGAAVATIVHLAQIWAERA